LTPFTIHGNIIIEYSNFVKGVGVMPEKDLDQRVEELEAKLDRLLESFDREKEQEKIIGIRDIDLEKYRVVCKLKPYFEKHRIRQVEVADRLDISDRTLGNILNNKFNTSLDTAFKLCAVLGLSIIEGFELIENIDEKQV
jgi:DNA-binding XRE family transcriptional regulator